VVISPIVQPNREYFRLLATSDAGVESSYTYKNSETIAHDALFQSQSFDSLLLTMDSHAAERSASDLASKSLDASDSSTDSTGLVTIDNEDLLHGDGVTHDMINVEREAV